MPGAGSLEISTSHVTPERVIQEFHTAQGDSYICVEIRDTGIGMDEATRQRIFEPFFTTKELGKGTGLGLSVAYGIIKSLGGQISVSSSIGKGTIFRLYFPVAGSVNNKSQSQAYEKEDIPGGNEVILLVEDEELLLDLLATLLETKGYTVLKAKDGEDALNVYTKHVHSISLVISDLGLPKRDGFHAFLSMKEINPAVKAIIATGYVSSEQEALFLQGGVKSIIVKPYVIHQILKSIREVLASK
jgi:CheY-like chemotaxis protein